MAEDCGYANDLGAKDKRARGPGEPSRGPHASYMLDFVPKKCGRYCAFWAPNFRYDAQGVDMGVSSIPSFCLED